MKRCAAVVVLAMTACLPPPEQLSSVRIYRGATLVDGTGSEPVEEAVIVVRDGRIDCAGKQGSCDLPANADVTDLAGKWIAPGLIDAHVHFAQTAWADGRPDGMNVTDNYPYAEVVAGQRDHVGIAYRSYLCSGITAVFDVGGFPWSWQLRDDELSTKVEGLAAPHVAAAGPLLTWVPARMSLPAEQVMIQITGADAGREAVRYVAASDSDAVKVWFLGVRPDAAGGPRPEDIDAWVLAVGDEARARALPLIVHATTLREAKVALRAGARLLVHSVEDQVVDDEFLQLAAEAGATYTPTLIVGANWWSMSEHAYSGEMPVIDDPNGCVDPATRAKIESTPGYREHPSVARLDDAAVQARRDRLARSAEVMAENLRRVHAAGIPVATGTDAGNPFTVHGPSIYAEMEAMQAAGIAAADIVSMSTRNGARVMGRGDEIGTIEAGKWADFVVLDSDPTADISAFRTVGTVVRAGEALEVTSLAFQERR